VVVGDETSAAQYSKCCTHACMHTRQEENRKIIHEEALSCILTKHKTKQEADTGGQIPLVGAMYNMVVEYGEIRGDVGQVSP